MSKRGVARLPRCREEANKELTSRRETLKPWNAYLREGKERQDGEEEGRRRLRGKLSEKKRDVPFRRTERKKKDGRDLAESRVSEGYSPKHPERRFAFKKIQK